MAEWGTGQKGNFHFLVPIDTSECNVKITFDKNVNGIKVRNGKNEQCDGKVCTFSHRIKKPLSKGQTLELAHRIGFESGGQRQVIGFEFNGEKICGIGIATTTQIPTSTTTATDLDEYGSEYEYEDPQCADIDGYK